MKQLTREQAIHIYDTGKYEKWSRRFQVKYQLYQERLFMPFGEFHKAVEEVLGRSVWTHEFAFPDSLIQEFEGRSSKPTIDDIVNLSPKDKTIAVVVTE